MESPLSIFRTRWDLEPKVVEDGALRRPRPYSGRNGWAARLDQSLVIDRPALRARAVTHHARFMVRSGDPGYGAN